MSYQLSIATDAANLSLFDFMSESILSEHNYLNALGILTTDYISVKTDSAKWSDDEKIAFLQKIEVVAKSQLSNKMILTEDFGTQWYNLEAGVSSVLDMLSKLDKKTKKESIKLKNLLLKADFPDMISRLKLIKKEKFKDSRINFVNEVLRKYNKE